MKSNSYLLNLVSKMSGKHLGSFSENILSDDIAKLAYEEARNIHDPRYLEELVHYITDETYHEEKRYFYFIFSNLIKNLEILEHLQFLIDRLLAEKNIDVLVTILSILAEIFKPSIIDLSPIFKCINSKNWQVRGKAYLALTNTEHSIEEFLRKKLENASNSNDQLYLLWALRYVGKDLSISIVEPFLKSRKFSIKNAASYTLAVILLRHGCTSKEISKRTKISIEGVETLQDKITELSKPG